MKTCKKETAWLTTAKRQSSTSVYPHAGWRRLIGHPWSGVCKIEETQRQPRKAARWINNRGKEDTMDFGIILLISNTLMAIFLYIVVKLIWQD
jgi:hypothetical protein